MKPHINDLKEGESLELMGLQGDPLVCAQLLEMGFTPGERVTLVARGPFRDPIALSVRGTVISLRLKEAECLKFS